MEDDDEIDEDGKNGGDEDDHDPSEITIEQVFDLALRKTTASAGPFAPGDNVTFSIEVINQGSIDATDVQVSDHIPSGLTLTDGSWMDNAGIATLNTPIPSVPAGESRTVNITFAIDADFVGTSIRNWAEISDAENALDQEDEDSTPDDTNFNQPGEENDLDDDDVIDEDGKDGR